MSPDPSATNNVMDALKIGGGSIIGAMIAAFAKNFFTSSGADAREFRQEYRDEIKRLREERARDQEEIEELREDVRALRGAMDDAVKEHAKQLSDLRAQVERLTIRNQHYLIGRSEARTLLNALERTLGRAETVWPLDPAEVGGV